MGDADMYPGGSIKRLTETFRPATMLSRPAAIIYVSIQHIWSLYLMNPIAQNEQLSAPRKGPLTRLPNPSDSAC